MTYRKSTLTVSTLALGSALLLAGGAIAGPKVVLGDLTWEEPRAINAILTEILVQNFDADVDTIAADQTAIFSAMARGDGTVDVHPAVWTAAQQANIDRFVTEEGAVRMNDAPYKAEDGFYVPAYMAEEHGVTSVEDLMNEETAQLFDVNGDGRGDFWPGAPGWGVANIYTVKYHSYGLDEYYDLLTASDGLLKGQLDSSYQKEEGVLFYYWTPEALHAAYDLVKLDEPEFTGYAMDAKKDDPDYNTEGCYKMVEPADDPDWIEKSSIDCATPAQDVYIAYAAALEERAPEVAAFLKNVAITPDEVGAWIYSMTVDGKSPEAMAEEWIAANPGRVEEWLDTDA